MPLRVFPKLTTPTLFFVGVTTRHSFINSLFPVWAGILGLKGVGLKGFDLPVNDKAESYREVVQFIKEENLARGALVTTHKINVYQHARDLFDHFDSYARLLGEVSSISKRDSELIGHAKDPITSGLALEDVVGNSYWKEHPEAEALVLGSGGSALALATYLLERPRDNQPKKITLTGRTPARLDHIERSFGPIDVKKVVECRLVAQGEDHDALLRLLPDFSLVVNATGMGKDRPGSPVTDSVLFPMHAVAWEFNYRGELEFLRQAEAQQASRKLLVEDGWRYFLHGWSQVIAEVFHFPLDGDLFNRLKEAADGLRQSS